MPELEPEAGTQDVDLEGGEEEPTGTPDADPEGGEEAGDGEPTADAEELAALRAEKEQWLREKSNLEASRRAIEEERTRLGQPQPSASRDEDDYDPSTDLAQLREDAKGDGPAARYARLMLNNYERIERTQQSLGTAVGYLSTPEQLREKATQLINQASQRGERISFKTAQQLIRGEELEAQSKALEADKAKINDKKAAADRGVVSTRTARASTDRAEKSPEKMTFSKFGDRYEKADLKQKAVLDEKYRNGEIELVPD